MRFMLSPLCEAAAPDQGRLHRGAPPRRDGVETVTLKLFALRPQVSSHAHPHFWCQNKGLKRNAILNTMKR